MPFLIVEYDHNPPLTDDQLAIDSAALGPCLDVRGIKRLRSWISQDRKRGLCEFYAPDAESVREAYRSAKVGFSKVWAGTLFTPGELPDDG
jgi:hypothetical protein